MPAQPKIEQIETFLVDLPTIRPHQLAMTTLSSQTLLIVRIHCTDGIVGIGEGTTIGGLAYGAESPEGMKLAIDTYFAPHLLKSNPNHVAATMAAIGKAVQETRIEIPQWLALDLQSSQEMRIAAQTEPFADA